MTAPTMLPSRSDASKAITAFSSQRGKESCRYREEAGLVD